MYNVVFQKYVGDEGSSLIPVFSSPFCPKIKLDFFIPVLQRRCYRCGGKGHIHVECRNRMKCFFCGYVGHSEAGCSLVLKFQQYIQAVQNGGLFVLNKITSVIGSNEETIKASEIF